MEDKAKSQATVRRERLLMLCAVMFAIGAAVMVAKHKPLHAGLYLGFALLESVGALYFRLRAKRS